jgi:hypothetical protein
VNNQINKTRQFALAIINGVVTVGFFRDRKEPKNKDEVTFTTKTYASVEEAYLSILLPVSFENRVAICTYDKGAKGDAELLSQLKELFKNEELMETLGLKTMDFAVQYLRCKNSLHPSQLRTAVRLKEYMDALQPTENEKQVSVSEETDPFAEKKCIMCGAPVGDILCNECDVAGEEWRGENGPPASKGRKSTLTRQLNERRRKYGWTETAN